MVILNSYVKLPEGNSQMHQMPSHNRSTPSPIGVTMAYQDPIHGWLMGWFLTLGLPHSISWFKNTMKTLDSIMIYL